MILYHKRPFATRHQPILREGAEPDASGGHHGAQDLADVEAVYPFEGGGSGGIAGEGLRMELNG